MKLISYESKRAEALKSHATMIKIIPFKAGL